MHFQLPEVPEEVLLNVYVEDGRKHKMHPDTSKSWIAMSQRN